MTAPRPPKVYLRALRPGSVFRLCRTGELFRFLRREQGINGRLRMVVQRPTEGRECSLHHSCFVEEVAC